MKSTNNILYFSKDKIFGDNFSDSERDSNPNYDYIDVFCYENLCQEYNFTTGETSLYIERPDNKYELLYETTIKDDLEDSTFYSKDSAFVLSGYNANTQNIGSLDYFSKTDFIKFLNSFSTSDKFPIISAAQYLLSPFLIAKYSTRLIENGINYKSEYSNKLLKEYKHLFIKYKCSTSYIPAYNILDSLISDIYSYIADKNFDINTIKRRYSELQFFKKVCPNSCSLLSSFINNPNSTDLRALCDNLKTNLNNIENLLSLYLKDELNLQTRGENDDCK